MLRRCLVLSGAFTLAIAFVLGFALESRAAKIDALERPARETSRDLLLGLARLDLGRDDNWRRTSRDDDDDKSRNNRSLSSRDGGKDKGKSRDDDDDDDNDRSWDLDDDGKSRDGDDDGKSRDDDDGKPSHKDDDDGKPKPHHNDDDDGKPKPHDDDDGGYSKPIPEPRAVLAFTIGALVVGWATRRSRR